MRPTFCLIGLSVLSALALAGSASAAPFYAAPDAGGQDLYGTDVSGDTLWKLMTNEGADGSTWEAAFRSTLANGPVTTYTDLALYNSAVGEHDVITFTEDEGVVSVDDILSDQYPGVSFDGNDIVEWYPLVYVSDEYGAGGWPDFTIEFAAPQTHLGVEFPGDLRIELYDGGSPVWSGDFGGAPTGNFGGVLLSDAVFDRVLLTDPNDGYAFIDDLHYVVPEPATLALVGLGGLAMIRRSRPTRGCR